MKILTKNVIARDLYSYPKIIAISTINLLCASFFLCTQNTTLFIVSVILTYLYIYVLSIKTNAIYRDEFVILKQKLVNVRNYEFCFKIGTLKTRKAKNLKKDDYAYIIYRGFTPLMVYKCEDYSLDGELKSFIVDEEYFDIF